MFSRVRCFRPVFVNNRLFSSSKAPLATLEFHQLADSALEHMYESLTILEDKLDEDEVDITFSQGVLNINLGKYGFWVINKQAPDRSIWWSSPISGPRRYYHISTIELNDDEITCLQSKGSIPDYDSLCKLPHSWVHNGKLIPRHEGILHTPLTIPPILPIGTTTMHMDIFKNIMNTLSDEIKECTSIDITSGSE